MGLKPAGGIKTAQEALEWMVLIKEELGKDWLTSERFRIGASTLLQDIGTQIIKIYEDKSIQRPLETSEEKKEDKGEEEKKLDEDDERQ